MIDRIEKNKIALDQIERISISKRSYGKGYYLVNAEDNWNIRKFDTYADAIKFVGKLPNVNSLSISSIPPQQWHFPKFLKDFNLKEFHLSNCKISSFPNYFGEFADLRMVELEYCDLRRILEFIRYCLSLKKLRLNFNSIDALPDWLGELNQLEYLDLSSNELTNLPNSLSRITSLETLNLKYNKISELPCVLGKVPHLKYLKLSHNKLTNLPECIVDSPNLKILTVSNNNFSNKPNVFQKLKKRGVVIIN